MSITPLTPESIHHELIRNAIPPWLTDASLQRVSALKTVRLNLPDWHRTASASEHQRLKEDIKDHWVAQNSVDKALSELQDVYAFAEPILKKALKDRFGLEEDVKETWLRLYEPVKTSWWVHDFASGNQSRTVSLLDAALHNFSSSETFTADSEFITRPDNRGHFRTKPIKHTMRIDQFKTLCRDLNLGAQYERHLKSFLLPADRLASNVLRYRVTQSQKSALKAAARMALMKKDLSQHAYAVVQGMLNEQKKPIWNGKAVSYYNLAMMDVALTGIVLITADVLTSNVPEPLIACVPNDPEHPLKEYPSSIEFMAELTRQLRDDPASPTPGSGRYQTFFSQFIAHSQRGAFFARLNARLSQVKWHQAAPGPNTPSWRETPVDNPNLQFSLSKIEDDRQTRFDGNLWKYLYQQKLNKILNDARDIVISTDYADRMARWAWWDNLEKMLSDILNVALLVATPLVPGLGELMLAYTAYQLTDEVVEGIVDLAEGHLAEAGEQAIGVLESVVQLGAFAAGAAVGKVANHKLSSFVEGLKPVQLADGKTRLWNPDLAPYQQPPSVALPSDTRPDTLGLYQHQGKRLLPLDGQLFEVEKAPDSDQHRIKHPQRTDAYAPALTHNGEGAWVSETENPRSWEGATLMRRIGHRVDTFTDTQLEQIRQISGTDETVLRRVHVDRAPLPPLLTDTLQRLGTSEKAAKVLSPDVTLLLIDFPDLPTPVAEKIIKGATLQEQQQMTQQRRLPLRLKTQARELQFETQSVRAAQGLYQDELINIDTERLLLGTLRTYTDTFGDLRIEIHQAAFDGELRCSAGPEDARLVRVLIRDEAGKYEVRDSADQPIHAADDFLEAVLHAIGTDQQKVLGYKPGDAKRFRQWLIAKSAAPSERRTVLAESPIRTIAEHETQLLVRGGFLSRDGYTLEERIQDLHPHFSENEVEAYAKALTDKGQPLVAIEQQRTELNTLRSILSRWRYRHGPEINYENPDIPSDTTESLSFRDNGGDHLVERLIDCFERRHSDLDSRTNPDSYTLDLSREMLPVNLETWWAKRPLELREFTDKVTVLKLDNTRFSGKTDGLLKNFPRLRELSAKSCELTALPEQIGTLRQLERLRLSDNEIVLDEQAVEKLKDLTYLEILRLDENPLGRVVDISRMPRLKVVSLKDTVIRTWPKGTLARPRPRGFVLDLRDNPISLIPDVVPGRPEAWVVGRTRLDVGNLSERNQMLYQEIRRSVQLPPEPIVSSNSLGEWPVNSHYNAQGWKDVPGWGIDRAHLESELRNEPRSERFLAVLLETKKSADYLAGGEAQKQLLQRVWRMQDAAYIDTPLREQLFTMAIEPVNCEDAGAQLFNQMGIRVLVSEAYSYATDQAELELKLVNLAKGAARLEQVNDIARADVATRGEGFDEVEIYLAYQTGLADSLDLPWQSKGMRYRESSGVNDDIINEAFDTVLALGEGDGLVSRMLEQDFWENHLAERYPVRMETNKQRHMVLFEQLETLRNTQREWVESTSDEQRAQLRNRLRELMNDLPVPETVVYADEPISDTQYDRLLVDLGDAEKELSRSLTREAMERAGQ
ncbi:hypothetical protein ACS77_18065 [Pseudomonas syringae]|uniref:RING-type E3 ubiquitin transferase n=1 Tax=Pseudomonas syringae TaxID=317 RepID=A0A0L1MAZ5_PSESX|nr:hypothetical protein ACS77_18065 [Pseudomonas syringae]